MKFNDLAWAAFLYYYKSSADRRYVKLFRDKEFISQLREAPWDVSYEEFEDKVVFNFISSIGLRLPTVRGEDNLLTQLIELHPRVAALQGEVLLNCDLADEGMLENITDIYNKLRGIHGFWLTGISKILHVLSDSLFVAINLSTSSYFGLLGEAEDFIKWLRIVQQSAQEITADFSESGLSGSPEQYLSEKLGYTNYGCQKSLARYLDEYYWLTTSENLPVPPKWLPQYNI